METVILYNTVGILSFILAKIADRKDKGNKLLIFTIVLLLSLLAGLRSQNVGIDTKSYVYIINTIYDEHGTFEKIFIGLIRLIGKWTLNYTVILCLFSVITNALIVIRYWQLKKVISFHWSILCYYVLFYFNTMSGIRQCLAVAIVFFFSKYVIEEWKLKRFFLGIVLAMLFHRTAVIGVLLMLPRFLREINIHKMKKSQLFIITTVPIIAIVAMILMKDRYMRFLSQTIAFDFGGMAIVRMIVVLLTTYQLHTTKSTYILKKTKDYILRTCIFSEYAVLFAVIISYMLPNVWRIGWYFWLFSPALYSYYISKKVRGTALNYIIRAGVVSIMLITWIGIINGYESRLVPYEFFWQAR